MIVERMSGRARAAGGALDADQLVELQRAADKVFVDPALMEYAVKLANATRISSVGLGELAHRITMARARAHRST